ncbi:MAG TPA: TIGR00730 family Rossman fold protein [Silvibacterium sp.]|nr:TIGR00730 family Rossman fold protein [Silvibacterium sp.]
MVDKLKKWVCVFCGSADGARPEYAAAAQELGRAIAKRGHGLVYGGAAVGLMGAMADAALGAGGEVVGAIPDAMMEREIGHRGLTELHVVRTMHERKALMAERANAFVALPGGYGTMDEFLEIVTWAQLGIHAQPCVLVNTGGYYDGLLGFFDTAVAEGFIQPKSRGLVQVAQDAAEALEIVDREWSVREEIPRHDKRLDRVVM